jgi:UDP-N-acetylmuramoyl-tripeptide--D-alanyl-D-alanine ligase
MKILEGVNNATLIDDTYNASPTALEAAIRTLAEVQTSGKKIIAMGDMLELGAYSVEAHRSAALQAAAVADVLVLVGVRMSSVAEAASEAGMKKENIILCEDSRVAGERLRALVGEGDVVLLKGSQSMRMERAVAALLAYGDRDRKLLVRQEKEWLKK